MKKRNNEKPENIEHLNVGILACGIAFLIGYGLLIVLTAWDGVAYLISSAVFFNVSAIFYFLMSVF